VIHALRNENIGIVDARGPGVTAVKEGDRAGVHWLYPACGHSEFCLAAQAPVCALAQSGGYTRNADFAEYIIADRNDVARIPVGLSAVDAAPLICAGMTPHKGPKEARATPGRRVVTGLWRASVLSRNPSQVPVT